MGRLVDTDDVIRNCKIIMADMFKYYPNCYFERDTALLLVKKLCETAPIIDPTKYGYQPVKHGYWRSGSYGGKYCSECGYPMATDSCVDFLDEEDQLHCYHCGAIMEGDEKL